MKKYLKNVSESYQARWLFHMIKSANRCLYKLIKTFQKRFDQSTIRNLKEMEPPVYKPKNEKGVLSAGRLCQCGLTYGKHSKNFLSHRIAAYVNSIFVHLNDRYSQIFMFALITRNIFNT